MCCVVIVPRALQLRVSAKKKIVLDDGNWIKARPSTLGSCASMLLVFGHVRGFKVFVLSLPQSGNKTFLKVKSWSEASLQKSPSDYTAQGIIELVHLW